MDEDHLHLAVFGEEGVELQGVAGRAEGPALVVGCDHGHPSPLEPLHQGQEAPATTERPAAHVEVAVDLHLVAGGDRGEGSAGFLLDLRRDRPFVRLVATLADVDQSGGHRCSAGGYRSKILRTSWRLVASSSTTSRMTFSLVGSGSGARGRFSNRSVTS